MNEEQTPPRPDSEPTVGSPDEPILNATTPPDIEPDKEARTMGMLTHLASLSGYFIPFGNIIGPLIIWLIKKDTMPFVDDQGKESLNFQINVTIALMACVLVGVLTCGFGFVIAAPLMVVIGIAALVFIIIAAIKANEGVRYRYPINIRFIK